MGVPDVEMVGATVVEFPVCAEDTALSEDEGSFSNLMVAEADQGSYRNLVIVQAVAEVNDGHVLPRITHWL